MQIDLHPNQNMRLYLEKTKYWACQGAHDCHQCKETAVKYDLHIKFQRFILKESIRGGRISTHLQGGVPLSCVWQIWPTTNTALWIRRRGEKRRKLIQHTRSIIASTRCAPCSRGVAGNSEWSADGASNKCSRDATSSSRGRGNTLSYCDAKTLKLGTMCFFPCKLFLVQRDGCNFLASQNVLSAYLPEQEVLLVNALPPQDLGETVFRQWLKETIAVRHGLKNWECVLIVIPPTTPWKASMGDAKLAQQKLFFYRADLMCLRIRSQSASKYKAIFIS